MPESYVTDNLRIRQIKPLIQPSILLEDIPAPQQVLDLVSNTRTAIRNALYGEDDRLVCIVGPCSLHDPEAAIDYAQQLKIIADRHSEDLIILMRTYFEKPRTVGGWKGLVYDPELDGSHKINKGLTLARGLLKDIGLIGLPAGCEMLDNILPQFTADLVSWTAIGARTTESQIHRQVASGSSMPIGFKNSTSGEVQAAIDAVRASAKSHWFPGVTKQGVTAIFETEGNDVCHVIMRGGSQPNYEKSFLDDASSKLLQHGLPSKLMVDCSHGNSGKDHTKQKLVASDLADQIKSGAENIFGVMIESFLKEGKQDSADLTSLEYGVSITDSCIGISETEEILGLLAEAKKA
jgi:3-deoxy-7-phosphoheptulonate synthase